jgi:hypothetical protein
LTSIPRALANALPNEASEAGRSLGWVHMKIEGLEEAMGFPPRVFMPSFFMCEVNTIRGKCCHGDSHED